jgi:hypothetical protein
MKMVSLSFSHLVGSNGRVLEHETQMVILEEKRFDKMAKSLKVKLPKIKV